MSYVELTPEECCRITIVQTRDVYLFRQQFDLITDKEKFFSTKDGYIVIRYAVSLSLKGNHVFLNIIGESFNITMDTLCGKDIDVREFVTRIVLTNTYGHSFC